MEMAAVVMVGSAGETGHDSYNGYYSQARLVVTRACIHRRSSVLGDFQYNPAPMTPVRFEHITKRFGSQTVALDDISLEIHSGELFFLLGPSGCGKSTLLRLVAGLNEPTSGRVWFGDRDVTELRTEKRN